MSAALSKNSLGEYKGYARVYIPRWWCTDQAVQEVKKWRYLWDSERKQGRNKKQRSKDKEMLNERNM